MTAGDGLRAGGDLARGWRRRPTLAAGLGICSAPWDVLELSYPFAICGSKRKLAHWWEGFFAKVM
jgi:hypothetical protein